MAAKLFAMFALVAVLSSRMVEAEIDCESLRPVVVAMRTYQRFEVSCCMCYMDVHYI